MFVSMYILSSGKFQIKRFNTIFIANQPCLCKFSDVTAVKISKKNKIKFHRKSVINESSEIRLFFLLLRCYEANSFLSFCN